MSRSLLAGLALAAFIWPACAQDMPPTRTDAEAARQTGEEAGDEEPLPEVLYEVEILPPPVRRMRERIMEAARSGDLEALRPVLEMNEMPPTTSFGAERRDPIEHWREIGEEGAEQEILAILVDVLEAGFLHVDAGTAQEMYVWPYFYRYPMDRLTDAQKVELFSIISGYDYRQMMDTLGTYTGYRVGIGPDGTWHYFVAGD